MCWLKWPHRQSELKSQSQQTETSGFQSLSDRDSLSTLSLRLQLLGAGCHGDPHLTSCLVWSCLFKGRKGGREETGIEVRGGSLGIISLSCGSLDPGSKLRLVLNPNQQNLE